MCVCVCVLPLAFLCGTLLCVADFSYRFGFPPARREQHMVPKKVSHGYGYVFCVVRFEQAMGQKFHNCP